MSLLVRHRFALPLWLFVSVALAVGAGLLVVGVSLARGARRWLAGAVLGGPALLVVTAGAAGLVGGVAEAVFALVLGVVGLVGVGFAACPLVLVGYRFARPLEATPAGTVRPRRDGSDSSASTRANGTSLARPLVASPWSMQSPSSRSPCSSAA